MQRLILLTAVLSIFYLNSLAQTPYYDAVKLRNGMRSVYIWKVENTRIDIRNRGTRLPDVEQSDAEKEFPNDSPKQRINDTLPISDSFRQVKKYTFLREEIKFATSDTVVRKEILVILKLYYKDSLETNKATIVSSYRTGSNEFLKKYIMAALGASPGSIFAKATSFVGNIGVTSLADGLAKFLVERTKEELNEAFFRKFADFLNHYPEFKTLFPYTNTFVNNFNSWEYSNLLNTLREAFDKDIKELLTNFVKLRKLTHDDCKESEDDADCDAKWCDDCKARMDALNNFFSNTNEGIFLLSAARIGNGLLQNEKTPDILNAVVQPDFLLGYRNADSAVGASLRNSLQLVNILSLSLRSEETGRNYITEAQFKELLKDPVLKDMYFGLIYQQIANANNGQGIKIGTVVITDILKPANIQGFEDYLSNVVGQAAHVQKAYEKLLSDKLDGKENLGPDYAAIFETTQKLLSATRSINIINSGLQFPAGIDAVFTNVSKSLQIAHDVAVRNYNAAVIGTLKFISDAIQPYIANKPELKEFAGAFLKYGSFASNVVLSKNPDDIKEAIKSFVLPSGSSSIKKHNLFTISLNSYVGFVYGSTNKSTYTTRSSAGADSIVKLNGGNMIGVYAPVGVGFNLGLGWKKKNPGSLSAFISLIDIGAVVGYRFVTDTGEISQKFKINLANIFAPGGNLIFGLPKVPISIGGGMQWIPSLQRDPKSNEFYNIDHSGMRWQVFIAVDLPLLNFHSSRQSLLYVRGAK